MIFQIEDDVDKELKMNFYQKERTRPNRYFNKLNFFILGCIAATAIGLNSKSVNSSILCNEILESLAKNMSIVMNTVLDLMEQPQKPPVKTILLELS